MKKSEIIEKYGVEEYERRLAKAKETWAANREKYITKKKEYYAAHRKEAATYYKRYRAEHREQVIQYAKRYNATPIGRANYLAGQYRDSDKKYNRGTCTITKEWIASNIFTKSCVYCGESDWTKLGCDRIDNNKPHTADNVVCCCGNCNVERQKMPFDEFMAMKKMKIYANGCNDPQ